VLNDGAVLAYRKDWFALARAIIMDPFVCVHPCQASSEITFSKRIKYFVQRENKKGHGLSSAGDKMMTGAQIERILNFLQETNRNNLPLDHSIPFVQTTDFNSVWKNIRVTDHNYTASGGVFEYICVEYVDASARAKMAVNTFGDAGVQGEMDFFHVPGVGADWQVGHIGFSDLKHRYYILGMIICRSENSKSAGKLIKQVLRLIHGHGGKMTCLLVDGGTALNKAIGDENAQNALLRQYSILKRRCFAHIIRMVGLVLSCIFG
jgi:hypothetical protein